MQHASTTSVSIRAVLLGGLLAAAVAVAVQQWSLNVAPIAVGVGSAVGGAVLGYVGGVSHWRGTWLPSLLTGLIATAACMVVMSRTGVAVLRPEFAVGWVLSVLVGAALAVPLARLGGTLRAEDG
ncbi:MAG: hypothetical protein WAW71_00995 [Propioniciclava sp.]|jgi:hypothetical protein